MSLTQNGTLNSGGTPTVLTDQANGLLLIDNGSTPQEAQRPILELPILANNLVDPSVDWFDAWDTSTSRMVRMSAMRASQLTYKADGLNDTRVGDLGSVNSSIYAVHDHIHPILAIVTPPATPIITASGTGLTITNQNLIRVLTEEESVTYHILVIATQTASNAWNALIVPSIAGYKTPSTLVGGTYRSSGNPNLAAGWQNAPSMAIEASNYRMSNNVYLNCFSRTQATTIEVFLSIKYILA